MDWLVYIVSVLLIVSKLLDCISTSVRIYEYREERNPLARYFMKWMGIQAVIWGIFGLTVIVVGGWLYLLHYWLTGFYWKLFYCIVGAFVSLVQFAVAHTNTTGRRNPVTRLLGRIWY